MFLIVRLCNVCHANINQHTIDAGGYSSIDAFHADLEQMFTNAKTYNVRGSQIYSDAIALQVLSYCVAYMILLINLLYHRN
jgi:hypothetical protein